MPNKQVFHSFFTWLLTFSLVLFTGASSVVQAAVVSPKSSTSTLTFLVKDTSAKLRYVKLAYDVMDNTTVTSTPHVIVPTNVTTRQTDNGLLVTVPDVNWNLSNVYQALVVTDKEVFETRIAANINQPVPLQPNFPLTIHADPPAGAHGNFQQQDLLLVLSQMEVNRHFMNMKPLFSVRVSPGMTYRVDDSFVSTSFEWLGRDEDHAYFLKPTEQYVQGEGTVLNIDHLYDLKFTMTNPDLKLSSIKSYNQPPPAGAEVSDEVTVGSLSGVYLSPSSDYSWNTSLTFADTSGNTYEYGPVAMTQPITFDTNFSAQMRLYRPIYHSGFKVDSYNDLGLTVSDSFGNRLLHVRNSSGHEMMGSLHFSAGQTSSSVPVSMAGSAVTLPDMPNTYAMTYQAPNAFPYPMKSQSLSLKLVPYPVDLSINPVYEGDTYVTGVGEPGMTVELDKDNTVLMSRTVQDDQTFALGITEYLPIGTMLTVKFTDPTTGYKAVLPVVVRALPAQVNPVKDIDSSVTGTASVGSTVSVSVSDQVIGHAVVPQSGQFKVSIPRLHGGTMLAVTVGNGKTSLGQSTTLVQVQGTLAPKAPVVTSAVNDATNEIRGNAEPGTTVTVKMGDIVVGTSSTFGSLGLFDIRTAFTPTAGSVLTFTATDAWNHTSAPTNVVVKDATAPDLPTVNPITDKDRYVTGTTEPNATVYVKDVNKKKLFGFGHAGKDGSFKIAVSSLVGTQMVNVSAQDAAGNLDDGQPCTVKDMTPPSAPYVKTVHHADTKITVTSELGATVFVTIGDSAQPIRVQVTAVNGVVNISVGSLQAGEKIQVYAVDQAKNQSATTTITVLK